MVNRYINYTHQYLFFFDFSLANNETPGHISEVFMGCFPCDTRLEAFPPYLGRVSSLTRPLFFLENHNDINCMEMLRLLMRHRFPARCRRFDYSPLGLTALHQCPQRGGMVVNAGKRHSTTGSPCPQGHDCHPSPMLIDCRRLSTSSVTPISRIH